MNSINPKKLLSSKWTAVAPMDKEKHFIISDVEFDENNEVMSCTIEAIITKRSQEIDWHDLKDDTCWAYGWK